MFCVNNVWAVGTANGNHAGGVLPFEFVVHVSGPVEWWPCVPFRGGLNEAM